MQAFSLFQPCQTDTQISFLQNCLMSTAVTAGVLFFSVTQIRDLNPRALGKAPGAPCNPRRSAPQGRSNPDFSAKKQRLRHTAGAHVGLIAFCRDGTTFGSCRFPFHPFIQRNKAHRIEADLDRMHVSANRGKSMAVKGHTFQGGSLLKEKGEINRSLLFFPEQ